MRLVEWLLAVLVAISIEGKQVPNTKVDCRDRGLSDKARRLFCDKTGIMQSQEGKPKRATSPAPTIITSLPSPTLEPLVAEEAKVEIFVKPDGPVEFSVPVSTESSNWLDDEDYEENSMPDCEDVETDTSEGVLCKNSTTPPPIVRWRDMVFERLISQSWEDTQAKISADMLVGGVTLDPLSVDKMAGREGPMVDISQSALIYQAYLKMWDIQVHGLSTIYLSNVLVTRAQNLYDLDMMAEFSIDSLVLVGTYNLNGSYGGFFGSEFTSDGDQTFDISITNATLTPHLVLDTSDELKSACGKNGDVLITELELPFVYDDISINFNNLGYGYNAVINGLSIFVMKTEEERLKQLARDFIKGAVNSLIC